MRTLHVIGVLLFTCVIIFVGVYLLREGFDDIQTQFVDDRLRNYNPTGIALIAADQVGALGSSTAPLMGSDGRPGLGQDAALSKFPLNTVDTGMFAIIAKCEAVITSDCSAFDDPTFGENCGLCLDIGSATNPALNSKGAASLGGRVLVPADRQFAAAETQSDFIPNYTPTVGTCPANRLVATKAECIRLSREMNCQKGANYDLAKCVQCYSDTSYHIVDPTENSTLIQGSGTLYLIGSGKLTFVETGYNTVSNIVLSKTTPRIIDLQGPEATRLSFTLTSTDTARPVLGGFLTGPTAAGTFNVDLYKLIISDTLTGRKPARAQPPTAKVNGIDVMMMSTGYGKTTMGLSGQSAFTFIDPTTMEASECSTSPYVSTQASAEFLDSDPCYKKNSGPGKFNLDCLQGMFIGNGCVTSGTGYPSDAVTSGTIMTNTNGTQRSLNDIADYVYSIAVITATGVDTNGTSLDIHTWSKASEFCTGQTIVTPCDTMSKDNGPLTPDCLAYLWNNTGQENRLGGTYNLLSMATSLFQQGNNTRFCTTAGTMSPYGLNGKPNATNVTYWQGQGGVDAVKSMMNVIHANANYLAGEMLDSDRADYINKCYGSIPLANRPGPLAAAAGTMCPTTGCGTMARYVTFFNNCGWIQVSQIAVYTINGTNVARNAILTMGIGVSAGWGSSLNGVINGSLSSKNQGFIGNKSGCQHIIMDLGQQYDIVQIAFYQSGSQPQMGGEIAVSNSSVDVDPNYTKIKSYAINSNNPKTVFNLTSSNPNPDCAKCIPNTCNYPRDRGSDVDGVCGLDGYGAPSETIPIPTPPPPSPPAPAPVSTAPPPPPPQPACTTSIPLTSYDSVYSDRIIYKLNQIVLWTDNNIYRMIQSVGAAGYSCDRSNYWQLATNTNIIYTDKGTYGNSTTYYKNDVVLFNGIKYLLTGNLQGAGWAPTGPGATSVLWIPYIPIVICS